MANRVGAGWNQLKQLPVKKTSIDRCVRAIIQYQLRELYTGVCMVEVCPPASDPLPVVWRSAPRFGECEGYMYR
ncbi:hypothetical protein GN244_ATG04142 [Phytophthora infestans]|uniref:Uncharacterized protein n=1 Tax=Phytophthora infestans TaxID=4787 RepID=A0A833W5W2_PHYIN|nr:hypothetical protein GN244_ATG04142 [Phytophthora infestans]KAF4149395.1 hypothetical protein GN958_ATG01367 [Phytophthora infestans]